MTLSRAADIADIPRGAPRSAISKPSLARMTEDHAALEFSTPAPRVLVSILNTDNYAKCRVTVEDMMAQDYPNFHLQVLDNASTDGSPEKLSATFPNLDVRSTGGNLGYTGGNNVALRQGLEENYDYVVILNEDLLIPPDFLTKIVATALRHSDVGLVGCMVKHHKTDTWQSCGGRFSWLKGMDHHVKQPPSSDVEDVRVTTVLGCAALFTRKALEGGLFMDEDLFLYADELDLGLRAANMGLNNYVCTRTIVRHDNVWSPGCLPQPGHAYYVTRNRVYLTMKYARWWQKPLFLARLCLEAVYKNVYYSRRGGRSLAGHYNRGLLHGFQGVRGSIGALELGR